MTLKGPIQNLEIKSIFSSFLKYFICSKYRVTSWPTKLAVQLGTYTLLQQFRPQVGALSTFFLTWSLFLSAAEHFGYKRRGRNMDLWAFKKNSQPMRNLVFIFVVWDARTVWTDRVRIALIRFYRIATYLRFSWTLVS